MSDENKLVFLWCVPRSVSTAFEKMMGSAGVFKTFGEPFIDVYKRALLSEKDKVEAQQDFDSACRLLLEESKVQPVFVKDMGYHALPFISNEVIKSSIHTFLIRDPRLSIPSLYRMRPEFSEDQPGFEGQLQLMSKVKEITRKMPFVMDGERLKLDAKNIVRDYFEFIGMAMPEDILSWPQGARAEWKGRESWHIDAIRSLGFEPTATKVSLDGLPERVKQSISDNLPIYKEMLDMLSEKSNDKNELIQPTK